jgi:hypothetical protein
VLLNQQSYTFLCENGNKNHELGTGFKSLHEISNDNGITVVNIQKSNCQSTMF